MIDDVERFREALVKDGMSATTIASYTRLAARAGNDPDGFLKSSIGLDTPTTTARTYHAAMLRWGAFLGLDEDAIRLPKTYILQRAYRGSLTPARLKRYREVVAPLHEPARTILLLLPLTGVRITEACSLPRHPWWNIGDDPGLRILGKGGKVRWVPLLDSAKALLDAYVTAIGLPADALCMFPGGHGFAYDEGERRPRKNPWYAADTVRYFLRQIRADVNGLAEVTPHVLRHTAASILANKGVDARVLQDILGHASISTTMRYIHPSTARLAEQMGKLE